jgi:hypothetical protein
LVDNHIVDFAGGVAKMFTIPCGSRSARLAMTKISHKIAMVRMHRLKDEATIRSVVNAVHSEPNGEIVSIERRIAAFEAEYRMGSEEMRARVDCGELAPTRNVEAWLMALRVRDELAGVKARAR